MSQIYYVSDYHLFHEYKLRDNPIFLNYFETCNIEELIRNNEIFYKKH